MKKTTKKEAGGDFYLMTCPEPEGKRVAMITYQPDDLDLDWATGTPMPKGLEMPVKASIEPGEGTHFVDLIEVPLPLMSKKLADAFKKMTIKNIEFFPSEILIEKTKKKVTDMVAFNVVGLATLADSNGFRIFRPEETPTNGLIVDKETMLSLKAQGFEDLVFSDPSNA